VSRNVDEALKVIAGGPAAGEAEPAEVPAPPAPSPGIEE